MTFSLKTWRKQESFPRAMTGGIASQAAGTDMVHWSVPGLFKDHWLDQYSCTEWGNKGVERDEVEE